MEHDNVFSNSIEMNDDTNCEVFQYVGIKCETNTETLLETESNVHSLYASDFYDTVKIKEEPRDEDFENESVMAVIGGEESGRAVIGCGDSVVIKQERNSQQQQISLRETSAQSDLQDASLAAFCSVDELPPSVPTWQEELPARTDPPPLSIKAGVESSSQLNKDSGERISTTKTTERTRDYALKNECPVCKQVFKLKSDVLKHISAVHCTEQLKCEICNEKFVNELPLRQHMTKVHNKPKCFNCPECALKFFRQCDLRSHTWKFHFDENKVGAVDNKSTSSNNVVVNLPGTYQSTPRNIAVKSTADKSQYKPIPILPAGKSQLNAATPLLLNVSNSTFNSPNCTQTTKYISQNNVANIAPNSESIVVKSLDGSKALGTLTRISNVNNLVFNPPLLANTSSIPIEQRIQNRKSRVKVVKSKLLLKAQENASQESILESWNNINKNTCPLCRKIFESLYKLRIHFYIVHMKEEMLECNYCESLHTCKANLSKHVIKYHIDSDISMRSVDKRNWVAEMLLDIYGQKDPTSCPLCKLKCKRRQLVKIHIIGYHMREHKFNCQYCSAKFGVKKELANHVIAHLIVNSNNDEQNVKKRIVDFLPQIEKGTCPICQKQFKGPCRKTVKRHIRRVHLSKEKNIKKYQCSVCFKIYLKPGSLKKHILKKHNIVTVC